MASAGSVWGLVDSPVSHLWQRRQTGPQYQGRPNITFPRHPEAAYVVLSRSPHMEAGGGGNTEWSRGVRVSGKCGVEAPTAVFLQKQPRVWLHVCPSCTGSLLGVYTAFSVFPGHSVDHPKSTASPNSQGGSCCLSASHPALHPPCHQSHSKTQIPRLEEQEQRAVTRSISFHLTDNFLKCCMQANSVDQMIF